MHAPAAQCTAGGKKSSAKKNEILLFSSTHHEKENLYDPPFDLSKLLQLPFATLPLLLKLQFLVLAADAGIRHIWSLMKHTRNKIKYLTHGEFT